MVVLGLNNRSEAVRQALLLLHREAAEVRVEADYAHQELAAVETALKVVLGLQG
jgi:Arc/MetJ-type ribon-helix-helix transcriptional regulator